MDTFDYKKYLAEGRLFEKEGVPHYTKDGKEWKGKTHKMPDDSLMSGNPHDKDGSGPNGESEKLFHKEDLNENIISEISDADIVKAVAIAADVSPKELVAKAKESEGENVDEAVLTTVLTAITIAGLIPPALNLLGNITNATSRAFKLTDEEKEDYDRLSREIKDASGDKKVALKKELDEKYGSKVGNWFKNAGTGLHHKYTSPIRKMLNFAGKFAKEGSSLKDKEKNEVRANIIYAVLMAGVAGFGIWTHIGHLKGIAPVAGFIADSVKEGVSIADIIEGAFELAKLA